MKTKKTRNYDIWKASAYAYLNNLYTELRKKKFDYISLSIPFINESLELCNMTSVEKIESLDRELKQYELFCWKERERIQNEWKEWFPEQYAKEFEKKTEETDKKNN